MLKIYTALTLLILFVVVVIRPQQRDYQQLLINKLNAFTQTYDYIIQKDLDYIEKQVEAYPQYMEYLVRSQQADSLFNKILTQQISNDSLLQFLNETYCEVKHEQLITRQDAIALQYIPKNKLEQAAQKSWILKEQIKLFNWFREKSQSSSIICSFGPEIVMIPNGIPQKGETVQYTFGLSEYSPNVQQMQIFVNDKCIPTKDQKGIYKQTTTQIGWNDLNIRFSANYKGFPLQDSMQYRFYVCE